jgi:hypothetical protein
MTAARRGRRQAAVPNGGGAADAAEPSRRTTARGEASRRRSWLPRSWTGRLFLGLVLWVPVAALLWTAVTPFYNLFLVRAVERMTRLGERPAVTQISLDRGEQAVISRSDTRAGGRLPYPLRATDLHFPLVLMVGLFLAVPGVPWSQRLENLGLALLVAVASHLLDLFFWVKFVYATQLGDWSLARYGPFARNFWGMGKHLLDLPVKLALPLLLWSVFYLRHLLKFPTASPPPAARSHL